MKQFRIVFFGGLLFTLAPIFWVDAQPPAQIDSKAFFRGISNNLHTHKSSKEVLASLAALEDLKDAMRNAHYNLISLMQHHPDPKVRLQATASLAAIAGPAHHTPFLVDNLMKVLDDKNVDVRAAGFGALGAMYPHSKKAVPEAVKAIKDGDPRIRRGAIHLIGVFAPDDKALIQILTAAIDDPDVGASTLGPGYNCVSMFAMMYLRSCKGSAKEAIPALIRSINEKRHDGFNQKVALQTLIAIQPDHSLAKRIAIECLKNKQDPNQVDRGARLLFQMGPHAKFAIPELIEVLKMPPTTNIETARSLKSITLSVFWSMGPVAKDALPFLKAMPERSDPNLRGAVEDAIKRVEGSK